MNPVFSPAIVLVIVDGYEPLYPPAIVLVLGEGYEALYPSSYSSTTCGRL